MTQYTKNESREGVREGGRKERGKEGKKKSNYQFRENTRMGEYIKPYHAGALSRKIQNVGTLQER